MGRLNSYRDKQVVHVQCRLSVSYLREKLLLSSPRRILFFSEKDRSLKRFYGKLILAVSDRARRAHGVPRRDDLLRSDRARYTSR